MTGLKDKKFLIGTIIITCIVLVSSRSFMAMNANSLSADHAIHILMTHDLVLPDDLYFWGQDRLGSIVPIFAHGLLRLFSLPPVVAVSWAQYFFLLLGFLAFASLLNNPGLKVVFALVWFLPLGNFTRFVEISHPYGPQMAFVGLAIVFARQLSDKAESLQPFVRQLLISALTASWFISIWISDFSVVLAFCFGVVIFGTSYRQTAAAPQIKGWRRFKLDQMDAINISGVSILAVAFLIFAKQHAANPRSYALFNSFSRTFSVISALVNSAINTLTFRASPSLSPLSQINVATAIHAILVVVTVGHIIRILFRLRRQNPLPISTGTIFFLVAGMASFAVLPCMFLSSGVNGLKLRYFAVVYICLWAAALLFTDGLLRSNLPGLGLKRAATQLGMLLICTALFSSWTLPSSVYALKPASSFVERLQPLLPLGKAGFIGDYWLSYRLCTVNPSQFNCIAYDSKGKTPCPPTQAKKRPLKSVGNNRCVRCIPKVFEEKVIYLIKEQWLASFPPEIEQFNRCLVKIGEPRKIAGYTLSPYQVRR